MEYFKSGTSKNTKLLQSPIFHPIFSKFTLFHGHRFPKKYKALLRETNG